VVISVQKLHLNIIPCSGICKRCGKFKGRGIEGKKSNCRKANKIFNRGFKKITSLGLLGGFEF